MKKYKVLEWRKNQLDDLWVRDLETGFTYIVDVVRDGTFVDLPDSETAENGDFDFDAFFEGLVGKTLEIESLTPARYYGNNVRIVEKASEVRK